MTTLLEIKGLTVRYGGIVALRGIDLALAPGEVLLLTGPNGAGKSTLLQALAGRVKPQAGRIVFDGHLTTGRAPETIASLGLSMVPEGRQVFGTLSVIENLRVGTGMRRDRLAVAADLEYVLDLFPVLRERARAQAGMLSGGQQQMLVIGRALMTAPKLLAIDEPSLGLAPKVTDQVYDALQKLQRERGLALLINEQSAARAARLGARMAMLREGRIVLAGDPRRLSAEAMRRAYFGIDDAVAA